MIAVTGKGKVGLMQGSAARSETAVHEAGHFVAAHHFGYPVAGHISIEPDAERSGPVHSESGEWSRPEEAFAKLVELLAGYRAQMRIAPLGRCLRSADQDLDIALRVLSSAFDEDSRLATFFRARRETDAILSSRWEEVLGIAGLLLECGSIDAESAEVWLDYAIGTEGVDAASVSRYFAIRAVAGGESLDRESVPPPEDVALRWKHYVHTGRCAVRASG